MLGRARARLRAYGRTLLQAHTAPGALAAAVLLGAIVGCLPLFGLHLPLCIVLAWALRLNQVAMYAAANVSIPPLVPFLGFSSVELGEWLLHGRFLPLTVSDFRHPEGGLLSLVRHFFVDWMVGGVAVGGAIGAALATGVYLVGRRRAREAAAHPIATRATPVSALTDETLDHAIAAAAQRYKGAPPNLRWYAFFKYRMDPCYRRIAALVPPGSSTLDLGTGLGMLPLLLALLPGERRAIGIEWDEDKRAAGERAAAGLGDRVRLIHGDARTCELPPSDVVTLVDMLHYFDAATQRALLARAAAALRPGGRLLVREGDAQRRGGGARWTRALEALAVRIGWNHGDGATRFRGAGELADELRALGLQVTVEPLAGRLHPGNVLLHAEHPPAAAAVGPAAGI